MDLIYNFTESYSFNTLELGVPINKNGAYVMKFTNKNNPVYIQPPKCMIRQGFFKSGKKMYCDLVFSIEDTHFFEWLEELEKKSVNTIYANRAKWFDTELDESDIENTMISPYKMYKAGKMFIVRTGVSVNLGKIELKIYDEDENELQHEELKDGTQVMVILEFKGIKCSAKSFQFDIEMKQMLVTKPVQLFQQCLLKKKSATDNFRPPVVETSLANMVDSRGPLPFQEESTEDVGFSTIHNDDVETTTTMPINEVALEEPVYLAENDVQTQTQTHTPIEIDIPYEVEEIIQEHGPDTTDGFTELDLEIEDAEPIQLKNRKDVYYKMYKEARQKAREAKILALTNYLEAKRIKNTYFLDDLSDEDSDLDELIKVNEEK